MRSRMSFRTDSVLLRCLLTGILLLHFTGSVLAWDYVDASPTGTEFPAWDGGDTVLRFADINADGHTDLLSIGDHGSPYVNTDQHGIMVYFSDGAGGWSIHMEGNFGYGGIAVGDVDNDRLLDVGYGMHHNYSGTDFGDQLIEVALGDGTGTAWTPWDDGLAANGEDWGMFATDFADIDHDGDLDLASNSFGCCNGIHVYRNNGDGTWTQTWESVGGNADAFLRFGDVNGDGHPDIAATHQAGTIWLGDGAGSFAAADAGLPAAGSLGLPGISLGDMNGDGCADLSLIMNAGVYVYQWRGDHWEDASNGLPTSGDYDISYLWDMNVDGLMDVAAIADGQVRVWTGDGQGNWSELGGSTHSPGSGSYALEVGGDVDHNGYPDLALVQREGSWPSYRNYLYVLKQASLPTERFVAMQFPRGSETLFVGSVHTIRWSAAHVGMGEASITLELSVSGPSGPWTPIATNIPDSGHYQWTVAASPSGAGRIRVTLNQDDEQTSAVSRAFRILSGNPAHLSEQSDSAASPLVLRILQNPVNSGDRVRFHVERNEASYDPSHDLTIHDASGRLLRRMPIDPGQVWLEWDPTDRIGRSLPAGIYFAGVQNSSGRARGPISRIVLLR